MFYNYIKIALRNLLRNRAYAFINIIGLSLGVAACALIAMYIHDETHYDAHYQKGDHLYRLVGVSQQGEKQGRDVDFPAPLASALAAELPSIELIGRLNPNALFTGGGNPVRRADARENHYEEGFAFADPSMLSLLEIPMLLGDAQSALAQPNSILISKRKADKYFPNENPIGKTLVLNDNNKAPLTIGGVMADAPQNTHFQFDFLITLSGLEFYPGEQTNWGASNYHCYLRLRPGTDAKQLEQAMLPAIFDKYLLSFFQKEGMDAKAIEELKTSIGLALQPVREIYLNPMEADDTFKHGDIRLIWLFGAIAGFILLIACVNFINLSTARSANRAREVGMRKAIGSQRSHLMLQFLAESILLSGFSFLLGLGLVRLSLPFFNLLAGKSLSIPWGAGPFVPIIVLSAVLIGLIAGLYPAFYLSAFQPIRVLKGDFKRTGQNTSLRSALVVFQFVVSIALIISTLVVWRQMSFILHKNLGFDKEQVVLLQGTHTLGQQLPVFKQALRQISGVQSVSVSDFLPITGAGTKRNGNTFWELGKDKNLDDVIIQKWDIDHDYIPTLNLQIVEGRNFSPELPTDTQSIIINRSLAQKLHLEQAVGKQITNGAQTLTVIGVVEDFHFESLREKINPVGLVLGHSPSITAIKIGSGELAQTLKAITGVWQGMAPHQAIRYTFLDEGFARMYADVQRMGHIFTIFAGFAIFVACLGLFALSSYLAERRTKEIGIRKVLGASVTGVAALLAKDFIKLVLVAILIASPVAWYFMQQWLSDFAYRIEMQWWMFVAAGVLAVAIALLTVGGQAVKAALVDPVKSLRSE